MPEAEDTALDAAMRLAGRLFDELATETSAAPGVTRIAYGPGERLAFSAVAAAARNWDAEIAFDCAGNQFITLPGRDRSARILIGSHLDSVPHGGNFDGAAGVIAGIAAQSMFTQGGLVPEVDITVACLRAEESCWFPHSYIGSKTALGILDPAVLDTMRRSDTGRTLAEHMAEEGFDPDGIRQGQQLFALGSILAYVEPHIEQAPVLVRADCPIGVVTGIRGSFRYRTIRCRGEYAHSGATPLKLRRDAVLASARLVTALQEIWRAREAGGDDLTITVGQISTDAMHHSFSKVAGEVTLSLDVRSQHVPTLQAVEADLLRLVGEIERETGTAFDLGERSGSNPALMSGGLVEMMSQACEKLGVSAPLMGSGAGHDAATFANAGVASVMLFIRNRNGSHNPDEHMDLADFEITLQVLFDMLRQPADRWRHL